MALRRIPCLEERRGSEMVYCKSPTFHRRHMQSQTMHPAFWTCDAGLQREKNDRGQTGMDVDIFAPSPGRSLVFVLWPDAGSSSTPRRLVRKRTPPLPRHHGKSTYQPRRHGEGAGDADLKQHLGLTCRTLFGRNVFLHPVFLQRGS